MLPGQLLELKDKVDEGYYPHSTPYQRRLFWAMICISPAAMVFHLLGAIKRTRLGGFWLIRCDSEGYLHSNVHVFIPILSAVKTIKLLNPELKSKKVVLIAMALLQRDLDTHIHGSTLVAQCCGYAVMHTLNWSRTFASIYAMPPARFHLALRRTKRSSVFNKTERVISVRLYNTLLILGYIYGVVIVVPPTILILHCIKQIDNHHQIVSEAIQSSLLFHSSSSDSAMLQAENDKKIHESLEEMGSAGRLMFKLVQLIIGGMLGINFISIILFLWAKTIIMRCLGRQLDIYRQSLSHREEAVQLGMLSTRGENPKSKRDLSTARSDELDCGVSTMPKNENRNPYGPSSTYIGSLMGLSQMLNWKGWLRMWLPTLQRGTVADHSLWKSSLMDLMIDQEEPSYHDRLRTQYLALRRYTTNTLWQAMLVILMSWSYLSMGIVLFCNGFDVPASKSYPDLVVLILEWSNLIWAIGGTVVAVLSAVVAFSRSPSFQKKGVQTTIANESTFIPNSRSPFEDAPLRSDFC